MEQRGGVPADHRRALYSAVELSARYGISRKRGYKGLTSYEAEGSTGLRDRRRAAPLL
jgi:transposase